MKMKYEKPMVAVDRYELSQAIAGCYINVNHTSSGCILESNADIGPLKDLAAQGCFVDLSVCMWDAKEGASYDGICIHTSANGVLVS